MRILLSKEECFEIVGELKTTYEEDLSLIAKAQLKRALEYLDKRSFGFQPKGESAIWVISCDKEALLKECE